MDSTDFPVGAVRTTREAIPHMLARGGGSVVMIGSVNAKLPEWNIVDYSATKAALASFAKSVSKEFGPKGIRVNTVSPGPVSTDLWLGDGGVAAQRQRQPDRHRGEAPRHLGWRRLPLEVDGLLPGHRAAVVEDTVIGVTAAVAAGMRVVAYAGDEDPAPLRVAGARTVRALGEVPGALGLS